MLSCPASYGRMPVGRACAAALLGLALYAVAVFPAEAVELLVAEAERVNDHYGAHVEMRVAASAETVRAMLTDYDHLDRLSGSVLESEVLERHDPTHVRVRLRARTCFLFIFCFTKTQVHEGIEEGEVLRSTIVPEGSDFKSGWVRWHITPEGETTLVRFDTELEPDFWIPPLIGPAVVKRTLVDEAMETMETIQAVASQARESAYVKEGDAAEPDGARGVITRPER